MKQLIILLSLLSIAFISKAQDKLITQSGDVKTVYNLQISSVKIFYTLESNENASAGASLPTRAGE